MTASGVADPTPGGPVAVRVIGVDPGRTPTRADALISAPACHPLKIRSSTVVEHRALDFLSREPRTV